MLGARIQIRKVTSGRAPYICFGEAHCPRCRRVTQFMQNRYVMQMFPCPDQVWRCAECEWPFEGEIVADTVPQSS